ncbi:DUF72 domain-containing protein [Pigmentiphaga aceris]|uniref:DUF72 domain-containing protein n=1 Tax=Pigmentiphaga aceris TaxID=1940612 RepID=A0A5C0B146_9BURK|nr:DUF72 domain-containing protein [Pigmentiphaga aceris]QEI07433.1 DUF72 domain-containing protein [Pigmentiphaga aceris]
MVARSKARTHIRVGIGGWTFAPWRDNFYPADLAQSRELEYASTQVTAIEINGTYYGTQKPSTFARWRDETPEDFVFSVKASRYATNRKVLGDAGESIAKFIGSGLAELGPKLGPILWELAPTKVFDPDDLRAFFALLPDKVDGLPLRHVLEVRHESFMCADYVALARKYRVATVFTDSPKFPSFADVTGDFVYARLMDAKSRLKAGYAPKALDAWADTARSWAQGNLPDALTYAAQPGKTTKPRDVFVFFINGAKERAPAAAMALLTRLAKG